MGPMSEPEDGLEEMQSWLAGISAGVPADDEAVQIGREVANLLDLVELGVDERLLVSSSRVLDAAYVRAAEEAAAVRGATISFATGEPAVRGLDALLRLESALGLGGAAEDLELLKRDALALLPGGRYLIELPNRERVVQNHVQNRLHTAADGRLYLERSELDFVTSRNRTTITRIGPDGSQSEIASHGRRLYTVTELAALLEAAGLTFAAVHGGIAAETYTPDAPWIVILARKT